MIVFNIFIKCCIGVVLIGFRGMMIILFNIIFIVIKSVVIVSFFDFI